MSAEFDVELGGPTHLNPADRSVRLTPTNLPVQLIEIHLAAMLPDRCDNIQSQR
jgi:hypothetical protein